MESKELKSILEKSASARVLEHGVISGSGAPYARVRPEDVRATLEFLRDRFEPRLEWLEHLSAADHAGTIVLNYFLRALTGRGEVVLKCALEPGPDDSWVDAAGASDLFRAAGAHEAEISELFGVRFSPAARRAPILPEGLERFPMRKGSGARA